jgi:hypothetical protein
VRLRARARVERVADCLSAAVRTSGAEGRCNHYAQSARSYEIYCPFKNTPNDMENAPIRFIFELTKSGWKFTALDNINE